MCWDNHSARAHYQSFALLGSCVFPHVVYYSLQCYPRPPLLAESPPGDSGPLYPKQVLLFRPPQARREEEGRLKTKGCEHGKKKTNSKGLLAFPNHFLFYFISIKPAGRALDFSEVHQHIPASRCLS